jgi:hypothetical protein
VEHWKKFYTDHKDYKKVGRVSHAPIDPASPIPPHCKEQKGKAQQPKQEAKKEARKENRKDEL